MAESGDQREERVLVLALFGGDATQTARILESIEVSAEICDDVVALCRRIEEGAGAAVIAEETLVSAGARLLAQTLEKQPAWSDFPLIVSTVQTEPGHVGFGLAAALGRTANVTLLERPVSRRAMASAVQSALRARRRQLEVRDLLNDLERTSRMKDEFLAVVSHELRTPLTAILGWSHILKSRTMEPPKLAAALETIARNAEAQARLVEDLLDVGRIISGKLGLDLALVDPASAVALAVEAISPTASLRGVSLHVGFDPRIGLARIDATRVQQIAWNLLSNAVKFTPRGGRVAVDLAVVADGFELVVRDTGCGIAPVFLPYVFERFRQQDASTTRRYGGLGLGLAIVKNLAELHGGRATVESPGEGQGATFRVRFPTESLGTARDRIGDEGLRIAAPALSAAAPPSLDGVRIVVVDDDADTRAVMEAMLVGAGAVVRTAAASSEGLQAVAEMRPHLVVADIAMPEEDGYTFVRRLRTRPPEAGGRTPAIALTAYAREDDRRRALIAGFTQHMSKPVDPARLLVEAAELARAGARTP